MRNLIIGIFAILVSGCGGGFKAADLTSSASSYSIACTPNAQQSCSTDNGIGSQTCNGSGSAWSACGNLTSCNVGYNLLHGQCVVDLCEPNAQQACQTDNGTGLQTCNSSGSAWGACTNLTSCNSGYNLQNGACVANLCTPNSQQSCQSGGIGSQTCNSSGSAWGACGNITSCSPGYSLINGVCLVNFCTPNAQQSCQTGNGKGSQTCGMGAWGSCGNLTSCNSGYNLQSGVCVANLCSPNAQQSCQAGNGTGSQACNSSGSAWGACGNITSCNSGYNLQGGVCVANACIPNAQQSCQAGNGTGTQTCNSSGSALGVCGNLTICNSGYILSGGACSAIQILQPGNYRLPGGEIFYSNGQGGYCGYANWNDFMLLGGNVNLNGVTEISTLPAGVQIGGACQLPASIVLSVDSFGADPTGSTDSTSAIQNAINTATASGVSSQIVLSAGTYTLTCASANPGSCLTIQNANNLTLKGQGAGLTQFVIGNPIMGLLVVSGSSNVTVSGFSLDYSSLPFTQGTIVQTYPDQGSFDVALESGYPSLNSPIFSPANLSTTFGMDFDPQLPQLKAGVQDNFGVLSTVPNPNGTWRVTVNLPGLPNVAAGDRFVLPIRGFMEFDFSNTSNITLSNVIVYAGPGMASVWTGNSGSIVINDFEIRLKPGTDRLLSTDADGIHMADNTVKLTIENCYIGGMADDAINLRSSAFAVTGTDGSSSVQFNTNDGYQQVSFGQTVQIVDPVTQLAKGTARISSLSVQSNGTTSITLNQPIPNIAVGDIMFNEQFAAPNALITGNTFANFRGSFRIRSSGAIFINNTIVNPINAFVLISADIAPLWHEGPSLVNSLNGVYFDGNSVQNGSITVLGVNGANLGAPALSGTNALITHPLVFNPEFYRLVNPDLASYNDQDITTHWVNHGIYEGRQATVSFLASEYLQLYPDLTSAFGSTGYLNAALHYLEHGAILEQRLGSIYGNNLVFDSLFYPSANLDLANYDSAQLGAHWLLHGIDEGRQASSTFYSRDYLARYPSIASTLGASNYRGSIYYFVTIGYAAGQNGQ